MTSTDKKARREMRERELGRVQHALPVRQYGVVYADPPWRFEPYSRETGMDRAADNHYPTLPIEKIMQLPVASVAAKDSVLFLWATAPMLPQALATIPAWGFDYKSHCVWIKNEFGTGYWFRNQHELLLVGTRGHIPAPAPGTQWASVTTQSRTKHSAKPEAFRLMIEALFPSLPKLELFARKRYPHWDAWGNEVSP